MILISFTTEKENRDASAAEVEKLKKQLAASQKKLQKSRELVEQANRKSIQP